MSLVAILDADKEGFLRSETSLIQTIGRAARNAEGKVIMYADTVTPSMRAAMDEMRAAGQKVAMAHFRYINPLPANTAEVLKKYPKVVVAEQNMGQLAGWLRMKVDGFCPAQYNEVKGQPFKVSELVEAFGKLNNA